MDCKASRIPYRQTNAFTPIALDYIDQAEKLRPFYSHPPTLQGIQKAIAERKKIPPNRKVLVEVLKKQYSSIDISEKVSSNIEALLDKNTFTITTAHQNNLFSGPLYFIYKIIHAIRLADHLNESVKGSRFVPVFYIGTEDADLEELNHIWLGGEKLVWETKQTGAVGRMKIDAALLKLIDRMEGELSIQPFGKELIEILRDCYKKGDDVQTATFRFVDKLFAEYGLVVLLPDNAALKAEMIPVFENELLNQTASPIVENTAAKLSEAGYKTQANPREINLFYLKDEVRERVELRNSPRLNDAVGQEYSILNTQFSFSEQQIREELKNNPERFSPNVILRGLYQETILPNIAFIGGAGELGYWLQLKELFEHYKIPMPVLVLRNSFLLVESKWKERTDKLGFTIDDLFLPEQELMNKLVLRDSKNDTRLNGSLPELEKLYKSFKEQAAAVDSTLGSHVEALRTKTLQRLQELEKKMLRAEKRKFADQQRQIHSIKEHFFPSNGLQERRENLCYYYSVWGNDFIRQLYINSLSLEQEFVILSTLVEV